MKISAQRWIRSASAAVLLLLLLVIPVSADENPPDALPNLFSEFDGKSMDGPVSPPDPHSPEVIRQRSAVVDSALLAQLGRSVPVPDQPAFRLNFFEDAQFAAYITRTETFFNGAVGLVGMVEGDEYSELVIVSHQDVVQAYLQVGAQTFEIRATGTGHLIVEVDPGAYPDELPPVVPPERGESRTGQTAANPAAAADSGAFIDVLAVYTPAAVSYLGSKLAVETRIQQSILSANNGYLDSGISQRLRLVGMEQVSYNENPEGVSYTDRWYYALDRLTFGTAYDGDSVHLTDARAYREQYGADLVFMVTNLPSIYCGLGWISGGPSDAAYGYSVIHAYCSGASSYTPQHEMGHNMGACHDWHNTSNTIKPYCWGDYSFGFQQPGQFYTVMAYSDGCGAGCIRINRWSNPGQTYNGFPLSGLAPHVDGQPDQTVLPYNTLTLNTTASNVANYRQSNISPINGSFINPSEDNLVLWPRTTLEFDPTSTDGAVTSVKFHAYYDGGWNALGEDTNGADGWTLLWDSSDISQQTINLRVVVTDSAANEKIILKEGLSLTSAMVTEGGYQSRAGGGEVESAEPAGSVEPPAVVEAAPEPLLTEDPPAQESSPPPAGTPPPQTSRPTPVIPESPPPILHHKHISRRLLLN